MLREPIGTPCANKEPIKKTERSYLMNVLVVENDGGVAEAITDLIENRGLAAETSATCADALKKIKQKEFDLALIDIFLPDGKGHHLIPQFKELWPDIWVVTMTGHNTRDLEVEVRRQGIIYYMTKPFETNAMIEILDHMTKKKNERR